MGTAGNWFIKRLLGSLGRELVTESAEARQEELMPSSRNIQYIPLHVSSMEEELEETPDKRKGWCHEKIPLRHVSVKKL